MTASVASGIIGTRRSLFPLPLILRISGKGKSDFFKLSASEILKPHPYRIMITARSLEETQGSFVDRDIKSIREFVAFIEMGLGKRVF